MRQYDLCTHYVVEEVGITQEVVIYGEVLEQHDRARYMGYSDGAFSKAGQGENLQDGTGV
jgi:hypothetical protein